MLFRGFTCHAVSMTVEQTVQTNANNVMKPVKPVIGAFICDSQNKNIDSIQACKLGLSL